jgi:glyoxylase-like metal-dependent hydrolase (beta-lactamase superfamily II)
MVAGVSRPRLVWEVSEVPDEADEEESGPSPEELAPGIARALSPMVRRIVAPNAGFMTGPGTNTYLVGIDEIAVIDPGPDSSEHMDAVVGCGGDRIRWILLTHGHLDHAPGAVELKKRSGAEVLAMGDIEDVAVDEQIGHAFVLEATEFRLKAIHTPGHASNHLCYQLQAERLLFSGDHVNNGQTVVINPPDGNMTAYIESLELLKTLRLKAIAPGHGHLIDEPKVVIDEYLTHRAEREQQVLDAVTDAGGITVDQLVETIYGDTIIELLQPVAARTTLAHLLKLKKEKKVRGRDESSRWRT